MIKADLARIVYDTHGGLSQSEAKGVVEVIVRAMSASLAQGRSVKLTGFGTLRVTARKGRLGRNPQNGGRIPLAPSRFVAFRASRTLQF
jgi:nucleoid DNA-binding protein